MFLPVLSTHDGHVCSALPIVFRNDAFSWYWSAAANICPIVLHLVHWCWRWQVHRRNHWWNLGSLPFKYGTISLAGPGLRGWGECGCREGRPLQQGGLQCSQNQASWDQAGRRAADIFNNHVHWRSFAWHFSRTCRQRATSWYQVRVQLGHPVWSLCGCADEQQWCSQSGRGCRLWYPFVQRYVLWTAFCCSPLLEKHYESSMFLYPTGSLAANNNLWVPNVFFLNQIQHGWTRNYLYENKLKRNLSLIMVSTCKGNGECVCENHGYTEVQCLEKGCCKFEHNVGKVPSQRIVYNFHSAENQNWNLASAFLMLERVPASKPAPTYHVMVYRCIIVEIILYIPLKCYDHHLAAVYERERRMCLRKPQLHGGSMSWEGLLQIWPQRRKGAFYSKKMSFENHNLNLASAYLMLERVPAWKPTPTPHVMVRCIREGIKKNRFF